MESGKREQSEFNMGVSYLGRMNFFIYEVDMAARSLDVFNWFHTLMVLFRELSPSMDDTEKEKWQEKRKQINYKISKYLKQRELGKTEVSPDLYDSLDEFNIFIMDLLQSSGLLNKMKEDAGVALN